MNQLQIMQYLRNVAEVDPNDIIANSASQLAAELEQPKRFQQLTDSDLQLIDYAISKQHVYVLFPGDKHATNLTPKSPLALPQE